MRHRVVQTVFPCGSPSNRLVRASTWTVPVTAAGPSVYHTVDLLERLLFRGKSGALRRIEDRVPLGSIVALHNVDGIRDVAQIKAMVHRVVGGGDIVHRSGLPNAKLVRTVAGERVLFDGHHTVLAYMAAGRDHLDEIPHLIVHNGCGFVSDEEILVFFGAHAGRLTASNWREHVINWQAPRDRQLCRRVQDNMGALFESLLEHGFRTDAVLGDPVGPVEPGRHGADRARPSLPPPGARPAVNWSP